MVRARSRICRSVGVLRMFCQIDRVVPPLNASLLSHAMNVNSFLFLNPIEVEIVHAVIAQRTRRCRRRTSRRRRAGGTSGDRDTRRPPSEGRVARLVDRLDQLHDEFGPWIGFVRLRLERERNVACRIRPPVLEEVRRAVGRIVVPVQIAIVLVERSLQERLVDRFDDVYRPTYALLM